MDSIEILCIDNGKTKIAEVLSKNDKHMKEQNSNDHDHSSDKEKSQSQKSTSTEKSNL